MEIIDKTNEVYNNFIIDEIIKYQTIILHRHIRPDGDCIGTQMGLYYFITSNFPKKRVLLTGDAIPSYLEKYAKIDTVLDSDYKDALVFVVDTSASDRICDKRYTTGKELIKIDHHNNSEDFGDINIVDENSPSCASILTKLFKKYSEEMGYIVSKECATCLYLGITTDTGRFRYRGVTGDIMIDAGYLVNKGVDLENLYNDLYIQDVAPLRLQGFVFNHFKCTENGVLYIHFTKRMMHKFGVEREEAANLVNSLANIRYHMIWLAFIDQEKIDETTQKKVKETRVRMRSRFITINDIAEKYHGGGHLQASGATVHNKKEFNELLKDCDERLKEYKEENPNVF